MRPQTLLRLYPRPWRERYGDEFRALLEQEEMRPGLVLNVVAGALDAWTSPKYVEAPLVMAAIAPDPVERTAWSRRDLPVIALIVIVPLIGNAVARIGLAGLGPVWWIETFTTPVGMIAMAWAGTAIWRLWEFSPLTRAVGALLWGLPMWILAVLGQIAS